MRNWIQWVLATVLTGLAAAGGFIPESWWFRAPYIGVVAVLAFLQAFLLYRGLKTGEALKVERTVEMNYVVVPLAASLATISRVSGLRKRQTSVAAFLADVTAACVGLTPAADCRATLYAIRGDAGSREFYPWSTIGRDDPSVSQFREDDGAEGSEVWRVASSKGYVFVKDLVHEEVPHLDRTRERAYRTFITVPMLCGDSVVGLLTLNAPKPGTLVEEDVGTMRMAASLGAAAIGMAGGVCPPRE